MSTLTKTEEKMLQQINRKGTALLLGSRSFSVCRRIEASYPNLKFDFSISRKAFGKSDWYGAQREACYSVSVRTR